MYEDYLMYLLPQCKWLSLVAAIRGGTTIRGDTAIRAAATIRARRMSVRTRSAVAPY
jgi:hypothetical protein